MGRPRGVLAAVCLVALLVTGCSGTSGDRDPGEGLRVVATTTQVADLAANVGGDRVRVVPERRKFRGLRLLMGEHVRGRSSARACRLLGMIDSSAEMVEPREAERARTAVHDSDHDTPRI